MAKIGLVLSGGGTRGLAHIGALKILQALGIKFDYVAGCSIGAIIGAFYAAGKSAKEMEDFILLNKVYKLLNFSLSSLGINKTSNLEKAIFDVIKVKKFEELKLPLFINATNLSQGQEVIFKSGDLFAAIRASIAVPGVFAPAKIKGDFYVDGGVLNQNPFAILPKDTSHYIIINASPFEKMGYKKKLNLVDILAASIKMMQNEISYLKLSQVPDDKVVLIEPDLEGRSLLQGTKHFHDLIRKGEQAALAKRSEIKNKFNI
ncbi:MAG: patatin-like phospholipase family protein [Patescibacteria group bacterium]